MTKENKELFKRAIIEGLSNKIDERIAEYKEEIVPSKKHKIAMNRIFREFGFLPFPEGDEGENI